ncbi:MAG TPA: phosphate ABC transporter permease PstA [Epulopiscium sp.]|nr:phosphate ABC transporter permease PstA [Candidatus Epulonipiscium sp.]
MTSNNSSRKIKDGILRGFINLATFTTVAVLLIILAFVFYRGLPGINVKFLTRMWDDVTQIVTVEKDLSSEKGRDDNYLSSLGIHLALEDGKVIISDVDKNSPVKAATNVQNKSYELKKYDIIEKAGKTNFRDISIEEVVDLIENEGSVVEMKVRRPGGGIVPTVVSTILIILITLVFALPIGIGTAIYLNEYAKPGKTLTTIRFAIQNLAGIPSIIYGLFGMLLFVQTLGMGYSVLAGSLTLSIMLLPTIISTTEETLKSVPNSYREGSYGLGATKLQTISKVILPTALPGILVAIILSIARIVGESAALIWTAGTVAQIPKSLVGNGASAATLTTKMYWLIKEASDLDTATSIAVVLIVLVVLLNVTSKYITNKFLNKRSAGQED